MDPNLVRISHHRIKDMALSCCYFGEFALGMSAANKRDVKMNTTHLQYINKCHTFHLIQCVSKRVRIDILQCPDVCSLPNERNSCNSL